MKQPEVSPPCGQVPLGALRLSLIQPVGDEQRHCSYFIGEEMRLVQGDTDDKAVPLQTFLWPQGSLLVS